MKLRAFTLIELLLVVAVLATLLGILLPALGRARASAESTQCLSNIRQLAIANDSYASEQRDLFAPGAVAIGSTNLKRWHGSRATLGEPFTPRGGALTPYLDGNSASTGVRACPAFAPRMDELRARGIGFELSCGGYGYNNAFVGVQRRQLIPGAWTVFTDQTGSLRSRFSSPARTIVFTDAALAADELIEYSFAEPCYWPDYASARPDPSIHFRHHGTAAVAWLDAHATHETRSFTQSSGLYTADSEALGTGWFGDATSNALYDYE
ncbi:MAG TPA: type II secretion system protein [Phycisphaerales bacterium]|nr:type II secretion system protein [Phycisphaerales bacterium]